MAEQSAHTEQPLTCQRQRIQELAESCDNEYYMSGVGPPVGSQDRAMRGRNRIEQWLLELEALKWKIECPACLQEIDRQLRLQRKAIQEIKSLWGMPD